MTPKQLELLEDWRNIIEEQLDNIINEMGSYPGSAIDKCLVIECVGDLLALHEAKTKAECAEIVEKQIENCNEDLTNSPYPVPAEGYLNRAKQKILDLNNNQNEK